MPKRLGTTALKDVLYSKVGLFLKLDHQGFDIPYMKNQDLCGFLLNLGGFVITLINSRSDM